MTKFLVGRSPLTTIAGYLVAILTGINQATTSGSHRWQDFLLPAAIALFGRLAGDDIRKNPPTSMPLAVPKYPDVPGTSPADFLRRGKAHRQRRSRNGQFAPASA